MDFHGRTTPDSIGTLGNFATYLPVILTVRADDPEGAAADVRSAIAEFKTRHAAHVQLNVATAEHPEFVRISMFEETPRSSRDIGVDDPGPIYGSHVDVTLLWSDSGLTLDMSGPYDLGPVWSAIQNRRAS